MHLIQQKLLKLADSYNLGIMALRDIGKILNEEELHPQLVKHHLEQLERKGLIEWDREKKIISRRNTGVNTNTDFIVIPVLGAANCGNANVYADERIEDHIKVSTSLLKNKTRVFAIRAVGYSMNKASINGKNIEEGDYVIVDPNDKNIVNNDYVLSVIDEMANIKKIIIDYQHNQIALFSESTFHYPPIYIDETEASRFIVNGKVIQVIKQPKC
jgi:SOS-response transcriptional repressor LexA